MHYNQFTIDYITAIKRHLKIEFNTNGEAVFLPDEIKPADIINLTAELKEIWSDSKNAIDLVKSKQDSIIQSGLFGLVNELDTALKVGFLISDRIILIDYLYERILLKKKPENIDIVHLGILASSLVNTLPLVEKGRIVIIPNPFDWNPESKQIIKEVATRTTLTPDLMSLLNMLSITKICKLHPYTIAESENVYNTIIESQIDTVDAIGKDGEEYAYGGILGALLSEKLLTETELKVILNVPLRHYFDIISSNKEFYSNYLEEITSGGSLSGETNIDSLRKRILKHIEEKNNIDLPIIAKAYTVAAGLGSGAIALVSTASVVSAPVMITGAVLALSATLTGLVNKKDKGEQPIISVFNKLFKAIH